MYKFSKGHVYSLLLSAQLCHSTPSASMTHQLPYHSLAELGLSGENLFMHPTGRVSAHNKLSSGLAAWENHHTVLSPPPALLPSSRFPSQPFHTFFIHFCLHLTCTRVAAVGQCLGSAIVALDLPGEKYCEDLGSWSWVVGKAWLQKQASLGRAWECDC